MRIIVDTNIVFSAILNTNSNIGRILLQPKSGLRFYSTDLLLFEIEEHRNKFLKISGFSEPELNKVIRLITSKIKFIDFNLIPASVLFEAQNLLADLDVDDTEFVALTNHIRGKLWSADKALQNGLYQKGWTKFISTQDLSRFLSKRK